MERKRFDREYNTSFYGEVDFLHSVGIRYEFVKMIDGISIFKYKKTPELFKALGSFYMQFKDKPQP